MASLLGLPTELLYDVLVRLEHKSLKDFRYVSRHCCASVTPLLFYEVYFDFDLGGIDSVVKISRHPHVATNVKSLILRRRSGLRKFDDFWMWRQATVYEYELLVSRDDRDEAELLEGIMSQNEWCKMNDDSRHALFDEYQDDYAAINRRTSQLTCAISSAIQTSHGYISVVQNSSESHQTIRGFNAAAERLRNIRSLRHCLSYHYDKWGKRWRLIQFHPEALASLSGYEDDVHTDALHLFVALRGIMLHADSIRNVTLHTRGHAFWSATHLRRLLDWSDSSTTRWVTEDHLAVGTDGWIDRIGGPVAVCRYMESATRYLARLESSFSHLESLECHVDTEGLGSSDENIAVSKAVSRALQCGTSLKKLRLALRQSSWDLDQHTLLYHDTSSTRRQLSPNSQHVQGFLLAWRNLFGGLVASQALGELQTLDLTVITVERHLCALLSQLHSLRHLALRYVSLLPAAGVWESVFQLISTSLRLESADLVGLEDVLDRYPRLLLQPEASVWNSSNITHKHYQRYETATLT